jgi:hypothetical protein
MLPIAPFPCGSRRGQRTSPFRWSFRACSNYGKPHYGRCVMWVDVIWQDATTNSFQFGVTELAKLRRAGQTCGFRFLPCIGRHDSPSIRPSTTIRARFVDERTIPGSVASCCSPRNRRRGFMPRLSSSTAVYHSSRGRGAAATPSVHHFDPRFPCARNLFASLNVLSRETDQSPLRAIHSSEHP